jgi:hypothetical protein
VSLHNFMNCPVLRRCVVGDEKYILADRNRAGFVSPYGPPEPVTGTALPFLPLQFITIHLSFSI